ncbi:hypothetical protein TNIN_97331 [Trichonephila inaurata madagascariensis]|uniref:Uncharacterized protein n=1 Tax=Trichonephila inaurata madagascariensis TaxID=2747483 RepID=A0A8X6XDI4_9ARAC|nr:hypothetical protein TNIN_97331 [Trichonephila inaurata madagascariensis]
MYNILIVQYGFALRHNLLPFSDRTSENIFEIFGSVKVVSENIFFSRQDFNIFELSNVQRCLVVGVRLTELPCREQPTMWMFRGTKCQVLCQLTQTWKLCPLQIRN